MTLRAAKIARLDAQIQEIEKAARPEFERRKALLGPQAEAFFVSFTKESRPHYRILRGGWPDYLLFDEQSKKPFCVEVKSVKDRLSKGQVQCFRLLEAIGLPVYIWMPTAPTMLTPWRKWLRRRPALRDKETADFLVEGRRS